jgi:phosphoglycerate kinase
VNKLVGLDVSAKRVFLRADLDVPLPNSNDQTPDSNTEVSTRLTNIKPTIEYLLGRGAKQVIIAGHVGRPKGPDPKLSTRHLIGQLRKILSRDVEFLESFESVQMSQVLLFENLRFWAGEVENDFEFAKDLARLVDVYVNDAFGNSHRNHASMVALPSMLPHAAGLHLQKEIDELTRILVNPDRPLVAIVGGAKIETKIPVISNLSKIAQTVLVGGELPIEINKTGQKFAENVIVATLMENQKDISSESQSRFVEIINGAKTVIWNGPMGLFEEGHVDGTLAVARAIAESGAYSVIGGGDSTQFLGKEGLLSNFSFVSAGGGAMLEFLSGKKLPGLEALG